MPRGIRINTTVLRARAHDVFIECMQGDIAEQVGFDAVVNATNAELTAEGGGVAGAIHRAAGPGLEEETRLHAPIEPGEAVVTSGHDLPNRYVIHCLGPDSPSAWRSKLHRRRSGHGGAGSRRCSGERARGNGSDRAAVSLAFAETLREDLPHVPLSMEHLERHKVAELRDELDRQLRRLERSMAVTETAMEPVKLDQTAVGRLSRIDSLQNQGLTRNLQEREQVKLAHIQEAFGRMEKGTYGLCVSCGGPIPFERLFVMPEAPTCAACGEPG